MIIPASVRVCARVRVCMCVLHMPHKEQERDNNTHKVSGRRARGLFWVALPPAAPSAPADAHLPRRGPVADASSVREGMEPVTLAPPTAAALLRISTSSGTIVSLRSVLIILLEGCHDNPPASS